MTERELIALTAAAAALGTAAAVTPRPDEEAVG